MMKMMKMKRLTEIEKKKKKDCVRGVKSFLLRSISMEMTGTNWLEDKRTRGFRLSD